MCHIKSAQPSAPSLIACLKQNSLLRDVVLKGKEGNEGGSLDFLSGLPYFFFFSFFKKKVPRKHSWHSERALDWS